MNLYLNIFLRSVLESLTEFLPVSSTGHLFLFGSFFPFEGISHSAEFDDLFDIFIQSGAILSVLVIFFPLFQEKLKGAFVYLRGDKEYREDWNFQLGILAGAVPIMIIGFALKKYLDVMKASPYLLLILACAWLIGGVIFLIVEKLSIPENAKTQMTPLHAFLVGFFQCLALIPGVSRSAATIITARLLGYSRKISAEYSFFLAVPVLIMASLYKLYKHRAILNSETIPYLLLGFFLTFVICTAVIKWFLSYIRKHTFEIFGYYRILLGFLVLIYYFVK
ncbi:MAG: undecaprenyl-diphosphate phosphatase [Leptospiraceae bacterium]|nr:undecaprenyl-diphosphate phosphatase [Leptospiraceae bacterium]